MKTNFFSNLSHLRQQQWERFVEMTKLELRILGRILPKSMNKTIFRYKCLHSCHC
jgi:hypothetical protein